MICTTKDCGTPTSTYLCAACVSDLDAWIRKARELEPDLGVTIHRLDVVRSAGNETVKGNKAGSAAPLNLDAYQLRVNIRSIDRTGAEYALDPFAAGMAALIAEWATKAELVISGPVAEHIDHVKIREKVRDIAPPMPTRELLPWLRKEAKIAITSQNVRDWVRRGHLKPFTRAPLPTYYPHEVIHAWNERNNA